MENKIIKVAAMGFIGLVVVPTVIRAGINLVALTANAISKTHYNHKIKHGLKKGTIVEIDGQYYEVAVTDAEEA